MLAIVKWPGIAPTVVDVKGDSYVCIRAILGGLLECLPETPQRDRGIVYYCDEEGKLKDLKPNIGLLGWGGRLSDVVVGPIVVVKYDEYENVVPMTDDEIAYHRNWLTARSVN